MMQSNTNDELMDRIVNNTIHPTAIVHKSVKMGSGNVIGAYCIIDANVTIGDNNNFTAWCSIGLPPEHKGIEDLFDYSYPFKVAIGSNNVFREFVTVHNGYAGDTVIGNDNYIMTKTHIGHDSVIGSNVTISSLAIIGGHSIIGDYANLGLGCVIHQFSNIGSGAMLGMGAVVPKNNYIEPFKIYVGNPVKCLKENLYLVNKLGKENNEVFDLRNTYLREFKRV